MESCEVLFRGRPTNTVRNSARAHLKLLFVKLLQQVVRHQLVKTLLQRLELVLDAALEPPVDVEAHVFLLVLFGQGNFVPIRYQLVRLHLTERVVLDGERRVDHASDVVVEHPAQAAMQFGIDALDVVERNRFVHQHFVKRQREPAVDVVAVEQRQADNAAHEVEVRQVVRVDRRVGVDLQRVDVFARVLEQAVARI